jgi:hypothetical protein
MRIDVVTIFPEFFDVLDVSLVGKAREKGILDVGVTNLRDFTHDVHRTVDDTPYGGGAGMVMKPEPWGEAIDALLGIGAQRGPEGLMAQWLIAIQASNGPVLCVDVPTGLLADTGDWLGDTHPYRATVNTLAQRHTLSLLTLKPGLFTADGQDAAGHVWFNDLGVAASPRPSAWLQQHGAATANRPHNSHKGSFGDVSVVGGAPGMVGAAWLALISGER